MVFLKQPLTEQTITVKVLDEPDFKEKLNRLKSKLISRFNKVHNKFFNGRTYKVFDDDEELREAENTLDIYLSQSIIFEDKAEIINEIKNSCKLNRKFGDEPFEIEYWGQNERIKNLNTSTKA